MAAVRRPVDLLVKHSFDVVKHINLSAVESFFGMKYDTVVPLF